MQADYNALLPYLFFTWIQEKESNSKRKRAVDCAGNNFLHGQKSTIAQLLSTLLEYQVCAFFAHRDYIESGTEKKDYKLF